MAPQIKTIHLLLLEPSSNHAEAIINALRNRGFAVRATQVLTPEELSSALEKQVSDCLLAVTNHPDLPPAQAIQQISQYGRDVPCIVMLEEFTEDSLLEAMNHGAKDAISHKNLDLLCLKVERELDALNVRRKKTQAELALRATEKRCTLLLDSSQDAIAYIHDGMHVYANNAYLELFGYEDHDELLCIPALDMIAKDSQTEFRQHLKDIASSGSQQSFSFNGTKADMSNFEALMTLSPATYDDESCTQVLIRAAADNAELEEKLKELSAQDTLTDLYNRNYFMDQLQEAIGRVNENAINANVLYLEYDQYDKISSEYGIAGVDQITIDSANWLSEQIDDKHLLARMGDHAFAILLEDVSAKEAKELATQLCNKVANHLFDIESHTVSLTFSIGICPLSEDSTDSAEIISDAHSASNRLDNGNGVKVFNRAYRDSGNGMDAQMLDKIQDAIEAGRISLLYQPIVKLHSEERQLYSTLLRLTDENEEVLPNAEVFAVAKAAGLAVKLDKWIIAQALKSIKAQDSEKPIQLLVSLSGASLIDPSITKFVDQTVLASKLQKDCLVFQIEETDATNHLKRVLTLAADFKSKGYALCLSDYGNIPEQRALIEQLDVDFVRISGELASRLSGDAEVQAQVQSLLDEIHNGDKLSIVPRVEEASMLAALWPMNACFIQGYYLQPPSANMNYDFSASGF